MRTGAMTSGGPASGGRHHMTGTYSKANDPYWSKKKHRTHRPTTPKIVSHKKPTIRPLPIGQPQPVM